MTQQKKETLNLDEQIQSLAGDIYVEIEDKVSSFVVNYIKNKDLSNEDVERHEHYQLLKSINEQLQISFETAEKDSVQQAVKFQKNIDLLNKNLIESDEKFNNLEQLNTAKLTDSEQVLKEKLAELSSMAEQLLSITAAEKKSQNALVSTQERNEEFGRKILLLEENAVNLAKTDKAKTATLAIQNQQISDLTLQLNNAVSELDYIKAEYNQNTTLTSQQLSQEKQQLIELQKISEHSKSEITKLHNELTSVNDAHLLTMNNEKQLYASLLEEYEGKTKQLNLTIIEYQKTSINADESIKELREKNIHLEKNINDKDAELKKTTQAIINKSETLKSLQEKLTKDQQQFEENLAQVHQKIMSLENELSEKATFIDESNQKLQKNTDELQQLIESHQLQISKQDEELIFSIKQLDLLQQKNDEISVELEKVQNFNVDLEKENLLLKEKANSAQENVVNIQQRVGISREKQELEYSKARETIKYLRDENTELNTKLEQQVSELEDKLREYRLRFEYAQKQLNNN